MPRSTAAKNTVTDGGGSCPYLPRKYLSTHVLESSSFLILSFLLRYVPDCRLFSETSYLVRGNSRHSIAPQSRKTAACCIHPLLALAHPGSRLSCIPTGYAPVQKSTLSSSIRYRQAARNSGNLPRIFYLDRRSRLCTADSRFVPRPYRSDMVPPSTFVDTYFVWTAPRVRRSVLYWVAASLASKVRTLVLYCSALLWQPVKAGAEDRDRVERERLGCFSDANLQSARTFCFSTFFLYPNLVTLRPARNPLPFPSPRPCPCLMPMPMPTSTSTSTAAHTKLLEYQV